jgi:DNA-directed RNA polymerase subunit RPC12/RpoP
MHEGIRKGCAQAAARAAWKLVASGPRAAAAPDMIDRLTGIVMSAIEEADRRRAGMRRFACLGCWRTLLFRADQEGRRVRCPACGRRQRAPERIGRN